MAKRVHVLVERITSELVPIPFRIMIEGVIHASNPHDAKGILLAAIREPASQVPGATEIRISATRRILGRPTSNRNVVRKGTNARQTKRRRKLRGGLAGLSAEERSAEMKRRSKVRWAKVKAQQKAANALEQLETVPTEPHSNGTGPTLASLRTSATRPKARSRQIETPFFRRRAISRSAVRKPLHEFRVTDDEIERRSTAWWDAIISAYLHKDALGNPDTPVDALCKANKIYPADLYDELRKRGISLRTKVKPEMV